MDPKDMEINRLRIQVTKLAGALIAINGIAGNLSDERVMAIGGVNGGTSRAIMVVSAREIAYTSLVGAGFGDETPRYCDLGQTEKKG